MKKFEADSLEKAYEMATLEFGCSITELSIEVFQQPSNGFWKKTSYNMCCL